MITLPSSQRIHEGLTEFCLFWNLHAHAHMNCCLKLPQLHVANYHILFNVLIIGMLVSSGFSVYLMTQSLESL